uniref:Reverse transcriptase domain-containing protein n=1 Tax=Panagrellus redivivus TaxID=6233 RepID=A0A7E4V160_PANRE
MEKLTEAFESLNPELAAKVAELTPMAMVDLMTTMTDPIRARALLNGEAAGAVAPVPQGEQASDAAGHQVLAQIQALLARNAVALPQPPEPIVEPVVAVPVPAVEAPTPAQMPTPDQAELLARCNALLATVTKAAEAKEKEASKVWVTKAYQAQYQFNKAIKILINAKEYEKAVAKIEARNADLCLSDSNPSLLATLDKAKQYSEGSGESLSNALVSVSVLCNVSESKLSRSPRSSQIVPLAPPRMVYRRPELPPSAPRPQQPSQAPLPRDTSAINATETATSPATVISSRAVQVPSIHRSQELSNLIVTCPPGSCYNKVEVRNPFDSLARNISGWEQINAPPHVLSSLRNGYSLPWRSQERPVERRNNAPSALEHASFVDEELTKLLKSGAARQVPEADLEQVQVVSPLSVVSNAEEKLRLVMNLTTVNPFITANKFRLEGVALAKTLIPQSGYLLTFDMKAGYHQARMADADLPYLAFSWRGTLYAMRALPFGLSSAPEYFTKLFRRPLAVLRSSGVECCLYLDDLIVWSDSYEGAIQSARKVRALFDLLGVVLNDEKSSVAPAREVKWLGVMFNLEAGTLKISEPRIVRALAKVEWLLAKRRPSALDRLKFTGAINSMHEVLGPMANIRTKSFFKFVSSVEPRFHLRLALSEDERRDLEFWSSELRARNYYKICPPLPPSLVLATDASATGVGVVKRDPAKLSVLCSAFREFSDSERVTSSTHREMLAVQFALKMYTAPMKAAAITIKTDNQNVPGILAKGSMKNDLNDLALAITEWCESKRIQLTAIWIPRAANAEADAASREVDPDDWSLSTDMARWLMDTFGKCECDRFASHRTNQLEKFMSRVPCPGSLAVNAFAFQWTSMTSWCVPPPALLVRTWTHISTHPCKGLLVCPDWPSHPISAAASKAVHKGIASLVHRVKAGTVCLVPPSASSGAFQTPYTQSDLLVYAFNSFHKF